jgi:LDH2 family malate/lactate/ureidoglycolate dehydrogenase
VPRLREFARQVLEMVGVPEEEAALFADILVEADCRGGGVPIEEAALRELEALGRRLGVSW